MSRGSTSSKIMFEKKEIGESRLSIRLACSTPAPSIICPRITVRPKAGNATLYTVFVFD